MRSVVDGSELDLLLCPISGCTGDVVEITIETYEGSVYLNENGRISDDAPDERERTDCTLDRYVCSKDGDHTWESEEELQEAIDAWINSEED